MEDEKSVDQKSSFNVGDIVTCTPMIAGASKYPTFGKIVKITPGRKYRIDFLESTLPPCDRNTQGTFGSRRLVKPGNQWQSNARLYERSLLAKWRSEYPDYLYANSKYHYGYGFWYHYDPNQDYWLVHDNGD